MTIRLITKIIGKFIESMAMYKLFYYANGCFRLKVFFVLFVCINESGVNFNVAFHEKDRNVCAFI